MFYFEAYSMEEFFFLKQMGKLVFIWKVFWILTSFELEIFDLVPFYCPNTEALSHWRHIIFRVNFIKITHCDKLFLPSESWLWLSTELVILTHLRLSFLRLVISLILVTMQYVYHFKGYFSRNLVLRIYFYFGTPVTYSSQIAISATFSHYAICISF